MTIFQGCSKTVSEASEQNERKYFCTVECQARSELSEHKHLWVTCLSSLGWCTKSYSRSREAYIMNSISHFVLFNRAQVALWYDERVLFSLVNTLHKCSSILELEYSVRYSMYNNMWSNKVRQKDVKECENLFCSPEDILIHLGARYLCIVKYRIYRMNGVPSELWCTERPRVVLSE